MKHETKELLSMMPFALILCIPVWAQKNQVVDLIFTILALLALAFQIYCGVSVKIENKRQWRQMEEEWEQQRVIFHKRRQQ